MTPLKQRPIALMPNSYINTYELPSCVDKDAILKKYNEFGILTYHTMVNHVLTLLPRILSECTEFLTLTIHYIKTDGTL